MTKCTKHLKRFHHRVFWCGFATCTGLNMAWQDWMGKEAYLALVQDKWMDLHWMVGATMAVAAIWFSGKVPPIEEKEHE